MMCNIYTTVLRVKGINSNLSFVTHSRFSLCVFLEISFDSSFYLVQEELVSNNKHCQTLIRVKPLICTN
jgi:hypothetical protein